MVIQEYKKGKDPKKLQRREEVNNGYLKKKKIIQECKEIETLILTVECCKCFGKEPGSF